MTISTSIAGKKDQLIGKLQERYGIVKGEAEHQADEWARAAVAQSEAVRRRTVG
jgi:uncharacterized protein YjbJ (UPF0337 family)